MKLSFKTAVVGAALVLTAAGALTIPAAPAEAGSVLHPFSADSPWNTPIDQAHAKYSDPNSIENRQFRDTSLANSWIGGESENLLFETPVNAPVAKWTFDTLNDGGRFSSNGTLQIQTPKKLTITQGGDGWSIFTDPDGVHYWETWAATYDASTRTYHVGYMVRGNLNGTGWGHDGAGAGIRAAGASLLGGLIQPEELDKLSIEHALPIELDWSQLKAGVNPSDQFVFPAVSADSDSTTSYHGTIPMGAHFALPADLDISHAGLTPHGHALAKAFQKYGGYVVDAAGHTASIAMVTGGTKQQLDNLHQDVAWIRDHLVMIFPAGDGHESRTLAQ
jgi:hypothetical protein